MDGLRYEAGPFIVSVIDLPGRRLLAARHIAYLNIGGFIPGPINVVNQVADLDLLVVSAYNFWDDPLSQSMIWLENDGQQNFTPWQIDDQPTHLVTVACGDLNGDDGDAFSNIDDNAYHVVEGASNTVIDGFTISAPRDGLVIVGIGSTLFGSFTASFSGDEITIDLSFLDSEGDIDLGADEIGRQKIRRKLNALKLPPNDPS